jgi:membrane fusion protein (multidrug efflux system)
MIKKLAIVLTGFVAVVVLLGAVKTAQVKEMMSVSHVPPPTAVTTAEAKAVDWQPYINAIGTLAPVEGATLSADADGIISRILADNGTAVKAGDVLVELDTSVEQAQLAAAEARANLAKVNFERNKDLWDRNANAKSEFDAADATYKQSVADVEAIKAQIAKKQVRAPFDGRVGIRLANVGQYVGRGRDLLPLLKLDPMYVNFSVPQRYLPAVAVGQEIEVQVDAFPGRNIVGRVTAVNAEVDPLTRNISVQATIANKDETLRAGMFTRIEVQLKGTESQIAVPATSIAYASYGNSVFVVEKIKDQEGHEFLGVRQKFVKLGASRGDLIVVSEGLKAGEQIVTSGVFKLRDGVPVQINNTATPGASEVPKPANT